MFVQFNFFTSFTHSNLTLTYCNTYNTKLATFTTNFTFLPHYDDDEWRETRDVDAMDASLTATSTGMMLGIIAPDCTLVYSR